MEGIPELGDEEEVFALHKPVFDGSGDAFAGFFFVAVVWEILCELRYEGERDRRGRKLTTSSVEQSVAHLDGVVHGVGTSSIVHLPQAETNLRHIMAGIELEGRRSHCLCSCVES